MRSWMRGGIAWRLAEQVFVRHLDQETLCSPENLGQMRRAPVDVKILFQNAVQHAAAGDNRAVHPLYVT
jgi:hypothetical protein